MKQLVNLLIVDDIEENLVFIEIIIKKLEVNIIKATSGIEALEKTVGLDLALAIIDVRMPEMNGYELAMRLNESRKIEKVPVIFLTASHINDIELYKGYDYGAVDYINKPVQNRILLSKINVFLDLYNQKQIIKKDALLLEKATDELIVLNAALKISEKKYRSYISYAPDGVFVADEKGRYIEVNESACRITGYSAEELLGMTIEDLLPEESLAAGLQYFKELIEKGAAKVDLEFIKKEGTKRWWSVEWVKLSDKRFLGFTKDITERKETENLVLQTRHNYETFFNTIDDFLFVLNEQGAIEHTNTTVIKRLGYSWEDLAGQNVLTVHPSERRNEAAQIIEDMLNKKAEFCAVPIVTKSGLQIPVETRVSHGFWNGKPAIFGVSKDITQIKYSEEKFSKVFYINPSACGLTEISTGRYVEVNEAFIRLFGFEKDEIIGHTPVELGILTAGNIELLISKSDEQGHTDNLEADLIAKNGDIKHVLLSSENISVQDTEFRYTVVHDITKRKIAETAIIESEHNLEEAQRIAHIGSWKWDLIDDSIFWSKEMYRVYDVNPGEFDQKPESILSLIHPDDVDLFTNSLNLNLKGYQSLSVEYRVIHKDGSIHYLSADGKFEYNDKGKATKIFGTVQDITQRRLEQDEILLMNNFLDSIVENLPDMIFIKEAETLKFVRLNQAGQELLGISKEEIIGKSDYDFFSKAEADGFTEKDRSVLQLKEKIDIAEEFIQTKNKGVRVLHTRKVPILNASGEPEYLLGISEDITELKQAALSIKITEEKYKTILNSSPDGIVLIDLRGMITEVSEIGLEIFGAINRDDLVGIRFFKFVPAGEKNTIREILFKTLNEGLAQNIELKIKKKNNSILATETSVTLIQDQKGKPLSFMVIIRDISYRKLMETKQFHADRMANLGQMAAGIAHEINQPLNIISMVMDKVLFEADRNDVIDIDFIKTKSAKIFDNIIRIRNIIDHIRDFSRSDNNYISSDFDINISVENAASMIMEQFKHLGIQLILNLEKLIPPIVGNTYKFEQVIVNLLNNAKDAVIEKKNSQEEYYDMVVGIRTYSKRQILIVEVTDNGIGISKDDINNILLPFYTTKEEGKGTGLGLSICYQIIKEMNGTINIDSDSINGTKVELVIEIHKK